MSKITVREIAEIVLNAETMDLKKVLEVSKYPALFVILTNIVNNFGEAFIDYIPDGISAENIEKAIKGELNINKSESVSQETAEIEKTEPEKVVETKEVEKEEPKTEKKTGRGRPKKVEEPKPVEKTEEPADDEEMDDWDLDESTEETKDEPQNDAEDDETDWDI